MVAVTVTLPAAVAVSVLPLMAAPVVPALFTDHTIVWLVALAGATVPVRVRELPTVPAVGTPEILVTATKVGSGDRVDAEEYADWALSPALLVADTL